MVHIRTPWVFQDLVEELDRMTRSAGWAFGSPCLTEETVKTGLNIQEDEASLSLDLPGVEDSGLEIVLEDNRLRITARRGDPHADEEEVVLRERSFGEFSRSYRLPWPVKEEDVEASLKQGVLRLRLKRAPEAAPRQIKVTSN